jgi:MFS family permease
MTNSVASGRLRAPLQDAGETTIQDWYSMNATEGRKSALFGPVSRQLLVGSVIQTFHFIALFASRPIFPLLASDLGASEVLIGLLTAVYYVLPLVIAIPAGVLVDRFGPRSMAIGGGISLIAGNALYAVASGFPALAAARVLCGVSQITVLLASQSYVAQLGRGAAQDRNFGTMFFFTGAGQLGGPLLGGFLAGAHGMRFALWAAAAVALIPLLLAFGLPGRRRWAEALVANGYLAPRPAGAGGGADVKADDGARVGAVGDGAGTSRRPGLFAQIGQLLRIPGLRLGVTASTILLLAEAARESFYPLYAQSVGMDEVAIGVLLSVNALFVVLIQPFAGALASALGRPKVLALAMLFGVAGNVAVPFTRAFWPMAASVALAGLALGTNQPPSMACVADATPPELRGLAMSLRLAGNRVGMLLSPVIAGWLVTMWGLGAYFYGAAGLLACGSALMLSLSGREPYRAGGHAGMSEPAAR